MHFAKFVATLALALPLVLAAQPVAALEAGKEYRVLSPAQPTETKGKIEVVEFFWYSCPHCFEFEPQLNEWARKLPKDVVLRRQPAILGDGWEAMTRAYYALEALGVAGRLHGDVFNALQVQEVNLNDPEVLFDWAAQHGVDKAKLKAAYASFGVSAKVARARQLSASFGLNGVPALAVNGKFVTSAYMTGGYEQVLKVVDALIAQERAVRGKKHK